LTRAERDAPTRSDVVEARARIRGNVRTTPVCTSESLSELCGIDLLFKCENLQKSGSFKYRGATNALMQLDGEARARGVATHSSGNHGSALAAVAKRFAVPAAIVVPRSASPSKRAAIERYGGTIVDCGDTLAEREATLADVVARSGATFIPPYDHPHIVAGQGSCGLELLEQSEGLDEVWLPVGGGGLAAGTVLACSGGPQVVGAEPELAADAAHSLASGTRQPAMPPRTVADGLRTALGELNFAILKQYGLPMRLVTESEIAAAQKLAMSCLKLVIEPSSAVPLAALMKYGPVNPASKCVAVILSGGNVDLAGLLAATE
jgi:threonine dehydratase